MFVLDLFNTKFERELNEGGVDNLEARRIDTLNDRMQELLARAREDNYKNNPAALAALRKQFQQVKDERDSYYKVREAGIPGNVPVEKIPGKEDLLKGKGRSYYESQKKNSEQVDEYISMGSDKNFVEAEPYKNYRIYVRKKPFGNTGMYTAHTEIDRKEFMGKGSSQEEAVQAMRDRIDFVLNAQKKVTGSSTIDFNVKFATDLLADPRQTFYAKLENINGGPKLVIASSEVASDPELLAAGDFKRSALRNQVDDSGRATPLPGIPLTAKGLRSGDWIANGRYTVGKETSDRDGNRVFDLTYHSTAHTKSDKLRLNQPAFTLGTAREVDEQSNLENDDWYDDEEDQETELRSGDYVRDTMDGEHGEIFRMQGDPYERRVRILDRDGKGWYIEPSRLTRVDPQDPDVQRYFGKKRVRDMDEAVDEKGALKSAQAAAKFIIRNLDDRAALKDYSMHFWSPEKFYQGATMAMRGAGYDEIVKQITQDRPAQFESGVEEGWKSTVGGAALAGAMALGAGGAQARVAGDNVDNPDVNRLTGKPNIAQTMQGDQAKPTAPSGYSKAYLQSVVDGTHPRPMVSKEKAQELLNQLREQNVAEGWSDAMLSQRTGQPRTPYSVYIKGRKWKDFENEDHARAVMDKLKAKFRADGRDPETITIAPTDMSEEKTRLDPKCWTGKKIGNPKTKVKGGVRVNNCVPAESVEEEAKKGLYYYVNKRKKAGTSRDKDDPRAPTAQAWKDAAKTAKKENVNEEQDSSGVERAILNRIMVAHTDLLMKFGPDKVMQAAEEVAYNVGDVDEIGTSDVSAYVAQVKQILGAV